MRAILKLGILGVLTLIAIAMVSKETEDDTAEDMEGAGNAMPGSF